MQDYYIGLFEIFNQIGKFSVIRNTQKNHGNLIQNGKHGNGLKNKTTHTQI